MSLPSDINPQLLASTEYNLQRSLRFRNSASAYMDQTFGTPTNNKIWTWSGWIKRGLIGTNTQLIMNASANGDEAFRFKNDTFEIYFGLAGVNGLLITSQVFRDPASFYHIVVAVDTTQATASNRVKIYINGSQITSFSYEAYPVQNYNTSINAPGNNVISVDGPDSLDGYLAEINFIDGQALTPSSFGKTDITTGVWQPAQYAGTYGANGFYLKFTDNSSLTTSSNVGLGKDFSGNGNYWRTVNISITAGVTYDSMTDVPTLTNATASNFAVLNPLTENFADSSSTTFRDANLWLYGNAGYGFSTIGMASGKWYAEFVVITSAANSSSFGIWKYPFINQTSIYGYQQTSYRYVAASGEIKNSATTLQTYNTWTTNDIISVAYDADTGKVYYAKNGVWQGSSNPATSTNPAVSGLSGTFVFGVNSNNSDCYANFGQRPFTYTPPTGFVALNTYNLQDSTIVKGNKVMDATTYTGIGTGGNLPVVNAASFKPDLIWGKNRTTAGNWHVLVDSNRGSSNFLFSNETAAEGTSGSPVFSINSNGFTAAYDNANMNELNSAIVAWQWQAGQGTNVTNTNGSITSTVSVNASAGFSIVTYTGTGANATVGHGLGVAPSLVIIKNRSAITNWAVYSSSFANADLYLLLNTGNQAGNEPTVWNSTAPTSSVINVGTNSLTNFSASTYVAYCWTPIAGYSAFGIYLGNGSTNGPFIYTGFRPKFILLKTTLSIDSWFMLDTSRSPFNVADDVLYANLANAESTLTVADILSNGFKLRSATDGNASGGNYYIYAAFAENPFKNALAR